MILVIDYIEFGVGYWFIIEGVLEDKDGIVFISL